jgi:hypothetical protein
VSQNLTTNTTTLSNASRLPKLILPTFDGNILNWQSFWDSYGAAVHNNPSLSDLQKFNCLKAQLCGNASRSIAGLPLTNANYVESVELLKERFGQSHIALSMPIWKHQLLNIPNPTNHLISLRCFTDSLRYGNALQVATPCCSFYYQRSQLVTQQISLLQVE